MKHINNVNHITNHITSIYNYSLFLKKYNEIKETISIESKLFLIGLAMGTSDKEILKVLLNDLIFADKKSGLGLDEHVGNILKSVDINTNIKLPTKHIFSINNQKQLTSEELDSLIIIKFRYDYFGIRLPSSANNYTKCVVTHDYLKLMSDEDIKLDYIKRLHTETTSDRFRKKKKSNSIIRLITIKKLNKRIDQKNK